MRRSRRLSLPDSGRSSRLFTSVWTPSASLAPRSIARSASASIRHQSAPSASSDQCQQSREATQHEAHARKRTERRHPVTIGPVESPDLVDCPHAERCPGCALIGLRGSEQLATKQAGLARALEAYETLRARPLPVRAAASRTGYRTRAKLVVAPGPRLGLHVRGGHEVLDLPGCRVLAPLLVDAAQALRGLLASPPENAEAVLRPDGDGAGRLRAVDLREVSNEDGAGVLLTLVLREPAPSERELDAAASALARVIPALRALALRLHDGRAPGLLGGPPRTLRGESRVRDRLLADQPFELVGSGSFAQAHRGQAASLRGDIERALGSLRGRRVLDVYAGTGGLGLALAARGAQPLLVESLRAGRACGRGGCPAAGPRARAALRTGRGCAACTRARERAFRCRGGEPTARGPSAARAGGALRARHGPAGLRLLRAGHAGARPRPPRRARLARGAARTLGPDAAHRSGGEPRAAAARAAARAARAPRRRHAGRGGQAALPADAPASRARDSLLARVRALPGRSEAVPLGRLDAGTSGVCLFASAPAHARGAPARARRGEPSAATSRWCAAWRAHAGASRAGSAIKAARGPP